MTGVLPDFSRFCGGWLVLNHAACRPAFADRAWVGFRRLDERCAKLRSNVSNCGKNHQIIGVERDSALKIVVVAAQQFQYWVCFFLVIGFARQIPKEAKRYV
ncbi:MAG: hypothetical protein KDI88_06960 [Gammaproteobacteria bacterium]|nr:hypothetical protein [Gammaproteobacteria bacterium]